MIRKSAFGTVPLICKIMFRNGYSVLSLNVLYEHPDLKVDPVRVAKWT